MEPDDPRVDELVAEMVERVGYNVRRIAKEKGWSLRKVSRVTGLNTQTLFNVLGGRTNPQMKTLVMLAEGLGVDVVDLLRSAPRHHQR